MNNPAGLWIYRQYKVNLSGMRSCLHTLIFMLCLHYVLNPIWYPNPPPGESHSSIAGRSTVSMLSSREISTLDSPAPKCPFRFEKRSKLCPRTFSGLGLSTGQLKTGVFLKSMCCERQSKQNPSLSLKTLKLSEMTGSLWYQLCESYLC